MITYHIIVKIKMIYLQTYLYKYLISLVYFKYIYTFIFNNIKHKRYKFFRKGYKTIFRILVISYFFMYKII